MKKWPLVIFLGIAIGFSCFVFWLAERPEPLEALPDTFEAEVVSVLGKNKWTVQVLGQRYTGGLSLDTGNLELPRLSRGFRVRVTLAPHDALKAYIPAQITDLQVLEPPPGITELTEQHLEGFILSYGLREGELLADNTTYHFQLSSDYDYYPRPGDRVSVSYYPGPYPDQLDFITELKLLEEVNWGIQLEVFDVTPYRLKLRIRRNPDFPLPLTVYDNILLYFPKESLPYSIPCLPLEPAADEGPYTLSGDDTFTIDFLKHFGPLRSGKYQILKTVYQGNTKQTYTVDFTISLPSVELGEGKPWPGQ